MLPFRRLITHPATLAVAVISVAAMFLFGPIFRGELPLPVRSLTGLTWGQPDQPAQDNIFRDRISQTYPYHLFAAEEIQAGHLPLWNDLIFAGTPFFANGQSGLLSLYKLPFWWFPPWLSFVMVTLLQSVVAGAGMVLLGRKLGWKTAAACVAGLVLTLSAPFVMRLTVNTMSAVIAGVPWLMWAVLRLHERLSWKRMVIFSGILALTILSGHVQLAALSLIYTTMWIILWWRRAQFRRRFAYFTLAFLFGVGLTAVQLVPMQESLSLAYRQPSHRSWASVLNPARLFKPSLEQASALATTVDQNIWGRDNHYRGPMNYLEGNLYVGPLAILLIVLALLIRQRRIRYGLMSVLVIELGFFVFPGWWDLVGNIAPWVTVTPVWRTSFFLALTSAVLAGYGADLMLRNFSWPPRLAWTLVAVVGLTSLAQWQGILPFAARPTVFPADPMLTRAAEETRDGSRLWTPNGVLNQLMPYGIPVVMGYDSVYPVRYLEVWSANSELRKRNQLHVKDPTSNMLAVAGADILLTHDPLPAGWGAIASSGHWILAQNASAVPPIHTVQRLIPEQNPAQLSAINIASEALVSGDVPTIAADAKSQVQFTSFTGVAPVVGVQTDKTTMLVTNLQFYPGWQAWSAQSGVEPKRLPLSLVNHAFIGVVVPPGYHEIEFRYRPRSIVVGAFISFGSLLLLVGSTWFLHRRQRQQAPAGAVVV